MKHLAYLIYITLWCGSILTGTFYAVFIYGHSGWWWLFAVFLMGSCLTPAKFGIEDKTPPKEDD